MAWPSACCPGDEQAAEQTPRDFRQDRWLTKATDLRPVSSRAVLCGRKKRQDQGPASCLAESGDSRCNEGRVTTSATVLHRISTIARHTDHRIARKTSGGVIPPLCGTDRESAKLPIMGSGKYTGRRQQDLEQSVATPVRGNRCCGQVNPPGDNFRSMLSLVAKTHSGFSLGWTTPSHSTLPT